METIGVLLGGSLLHSAYANLVDTYGGQRKQSREGERSGTDDDSSIVESNSLSRLHVETRYAIVQLLSPSSHRDLF